VPSKTRIGGTANSQLSERHALCSPHTASMRKKGSKGYSVCMLRRNGKSSPYARIAPSMYAAAISSGAGRRRSSAGTSSATPYTANSSSTACMEEMKKRHTSATKALSAPAYQARLAATGCGSMLPPAARLNST
jgi:hypothetical protein